MTRKFLFMTVSASFVFLQSSAPFPHSPIQSMMDRQDQRKRAFSRAFQRMNQPGIGESHSQVAKRALSYLLSSTAPYHHEFNQENECPLNLDSSLVFEALPGTQVRHRPPADLQQLNSIRYDRTSLQHELHGNSLRQELRYGAGAMPPLVVGSRNLDGPVPCEPVLPTPQFVRGKSMFGPSPYIRPESSLLSDNIVGACTFCPQFGRALAIYEDGGSPMSDTIDSPTPSALNFSDLSLNSQGDSICSSPVRNSDYSNHATVKIVPTSSLASAYLDINPNEVIVLFNRCKETRKVDKHLLCSASRFFAKLLDAPLVDSSLTLCIRLSNDFPYAIITTLHFIETGNYMCDPRAFTRFPLLTTLDFHIHAYLVGSKYGIPALQDCALRAYLGIAEHEIQLGFLSLSSSRLSDVQASVPEAPDMSPADGHVDGELIMTSIDRFLNSLVLLWKNTNNRYDVMRKAVLELIKGNLNKLLRFPFFVTLLEAMVAFGDDVVASLRDDGFEVKALQIPVGKKQNHAVWFGM